MTHIHEEDCPFTEEEMARALALAYPPEQAAAWARGLASRDPDPRAVEERRAISREFLIIPDYWFALVAALGPELEERVEQWGQRNRDAARPSREQHAMDKAGLPRGTPLTPEVARRLADEDQRGEAGWHALRAQVAALLSLPLEARWRETATAQLLAVTPISAEDTNALPVRALEPAVDYYRSVLHFSLVRRDESTASLSRDEVELRLVLNPEHEPGKAGSIAIEVDDLEALHRELRHSGADPGEFGIDEWNGRSHRTFFVRESENGYCYCFFHPLEPAVTAP